MESLVALSIEDDGLTIETNYGYKALCHFFGKWFEKNNIALPESIDKFRIRFLVKSEAMMFWLTFAGKSNTKVSGDGEGVIPWLQSTFVEAKTRPLKTSFSLTRDVGNKM